MNTDHQTHGKEADLHIGPAGWQYPDWKGIVYPEGARDALALLCRWVNLAEINVTYYRPVAARMCASWLERVHANPRFMFTAKAPALLTHERGAVPDAGCAASFRKSLLPLDGAGKLGAVLVQFPWSFKRTPAARTYLARLADLLTGMPLCVELRHQSWVTPEFFEGLRERGIAFCNIDQPELKDCIEPSEMVTASFGYVRLHGRNRDAWFSKDAGRDARYDYLYSKEELAPWVEKITHMKKQVNDLYIVTNNHFHGKAVVNAVELQASCGEPPKSLPETLVYAYPRLKEILGTT